VNPDSWIEFMSPAEENHGLRGQTAHAFLEAHADSSAELGELASRMAHEIRNPLNAIRMQVAVIRNKLLNPSPDNLDVAWGQLERLEQETLRVENLVKCFLEWCRPPANEPEDIHLPRMLKEVADLVRSKFEESGHRLTVQRRRNNRLWVHMDRSRLQRVLSNVLSNALHAMASPGQVVIRPVQRGQASVAIQIEDTGSGIRPENLSRVFHPFYSTDNGGHGLGLPIAKRMVEAAGGSIGVDSRPGKGSCFEIILPLSREPGTHSS